MHWAVSDIHGCYEEYRGLLEKIRFSPQDTLYFLGDAVDRGPEPLKVVLDLAGRENVLPLLGNHDWLAWRVLAGFGETIAKGQLPKGTGQEVALYYFWRKRGGQTTLDDYRRASPSQRQEMLDYFARCRLWYQKRIGGRLYWMVHAGLGDYAPHRPPQSYTPRQLLIQRDDYITPFSGDFFLLSGHTPTAVIDPDYAGRIWQGNGRIAIDCGISHGMRLGAYCLENGQCVYFP